MPYLDRTRNWVEKFVIGLKLCPFAKRPFGQGRIRFVVEETTEMETLAVTLVAECRRLVRVPASETETTLIIHPNILQDFDAYLDFVSIAEGLIEQLGLEGIIQVASFHPDYQFAGTNTGDPENFTNRSPYPMLHLLREASVEEALAQWEDPESIPAENIRKMNQLGLEGIRKLWAEISMNFPG